MAKLLTFSQYLGGPDNVATIELFPGDQKTYTYDFNTDIGGYTFTADYQSVLLDTVTYDRATGDPNFADSSVIGYFTNTANVDAALINVVDANAGTVEFTIPSDRYDGRIFPNSRNNVVATIVSFQWDTGTVPPVRDRHRWCVLERFDPKVGSVPGDPSRENTFVPMSNS